MDKLTIRAFMTPTPHMVNVDQSLSAARELMRQHRIRHLPVLDSGQLVGVVSDRDVDVIGGLAGVNPDNVSVSEAMTTDPHTISPDSSLEWLAATMAQGKFDSASVVDNGRVVGIFTTVDALRALGELLRRARRRRRPAKAQSQRAGFLPR
jgi:acetoin utilization protein AcuB